MFAIALWDAAATGWCSPATGSARSRCSGHRLPDGTLAFASELKALLQLPGVSREVDPAALDAYLALQYVPGGTALRGVEKLPPGHVLVAEGGSVRVEPLLAARAAPEERSRRGVARAGPRDGGRGGARRLVADVPLGALLSGGIDSSIVVAEMAKASRARAHVHGRLRHDRYDERAYARAVAERYGTEHEEIVVEPRSRRAPAAPRPGVDEPLGDEAALPSSSSRSSRAGA